MAPASRGGRFPGPFVCRNRESGQSQRRHRERFTTHRIDGSPSRGDGSSEIPQGDHRRLRITRPGVHLPSSRHGSGYFHAGGNVRGTPGPDQQQPPFRADSSRQNPLVGRYPIATVASRSHGAGHQLTVGWRQASAVSIGTPKIAPGNLSNRPHLRYPAPVYVSARWRGQCPEPSIARSGIGQRLDAPPPRSPDPRNHRTWTNADWS